MTHPHVVSAVPEKLSGREFLRRFRWLIFHTRNIRSILELAFILIIFMHLTPG